MNIESWAQCPVVVPAAVENLRSKLGVLNVATNHFDALVRSIGDYFRSPDRKKRALPDRRDPRTVEPGQEPLPDGTVLVRRRTLDVADSGEFILDREGWMRLRDGVQDAYREWQAALDIAIECAVGLRALRLRFASNLSEDWFTHLLADLRELKAMRDPSTYKDGSCFWKYNSSGLPRRAVEIVQGLERARCFLADATPGTAVGKYTNADVLRLIGSESIRLDKLPSDMGARHLRPVDLSGMIKVRQWMRVPRGDPRFPIFEEEPWQWFSPCSTPFSAGDLSWEMLFQTMAPPLSPAPEVALTDAGLVALDVCTAAPEPVDAGSGGDGWANPISNAELADECGYKEANHMAGLLRMALAKAGKAVPPARAGVPLSWTHQQLRTAYPHLQGGKLKAALEVSGFGNPETSRNMPKHPEKPKKPGQK